MEFVEKRGGGQNLPSNVVIKGKKNYTPYKKPEEKKEAPPPEKKKAPAKKPAGKSVGAV